MVHVVCRMELSDGRIYGASFVLDETDSSSFGAL